MEATFSPETIVTLEMVEAWMPDDHRIVALRQVYERARRQFDYNHRVTNALLLLLNGHVVSMIPVSKQDGVDWVFKIRSQTSPNVVFTVTKDKCNCVDYHNPQSKQWCKHRIARAMVLRTQQVIAYRVKRGMV